ncbi:uncharacterized protein PITG_04383 [Phytophthora infestans T30-4]|uniref:Uncharacterized protein n=1 Tax=Phytophthora infestans (strain T30-4) TaxID=403677 RepID=D0N153_PHYIT|nr:uncharacterized protein PITG_04383 [Phytophthora infestans T30-4]EEY67366.1 hypothetical protein PITG_04383 [Phytophthora infestans T30-4]|eukprot:XP_002906014.1 hypothetical protein PITG_04383 [Phytophthora infestans T30-4]
MFWGAINFVGLLTRRLQRVLTATSVKVRHLIAAWAATDVEVRVEWEG